MRRLLVLLGLGGVFRRVPTAVKVVDLRIYPIKSCRGVSLQSTRMSPTGLEWDRMFAIVNDRDAIQTQRQNRKLATLSATIDQSSGTMTLSADDMEPLALPLQGAEGEDCVRRTIRLRPDGSGLEMPVWQYPPEVTAWLTTALRGTPGLSLRGADRQSPNREYKLVRLDRAARGGFERRVVDDVGGENAEAQDQVAFPDLFPLLITTRESLEELNRQVSGLEVTMDRFRPNIVVAGASEPFDEDKWAIVSIGDGDRSLPLRCLEQDPRCQVPSINQQTGEKNPKFEPTTTLRRIRQISQSPFVGKAGLLAQAGPMFGIYACHGGRPGELRVGDSLDVLERSTSGSLHEHWTERKKRKAET